LKDGGDRNREPQLGTEFMESVTNTYSIVNFRTVFINSNNL
jgi:hypothetical protein